MNMSEKLKLAIAMGSVIVIGVSAIVLTSTKHKSEDTSAESIEIAIELVSETPTTCAVTERSTAPAKSTTNKSTTSTTSTITTSVSITTELISEPVTELATEPVESEPVFDLETTLEEESVVSNSSVGSLIRSGMRGTYYAPGEWNGYSSIGGSGKALLDCNYGSDGYAKGSIASGYLYNLLGYSWNGERTTVWLEVAEYPDMTGIYYLDDCSGADVIDFFYNSNSNCQFCYSGVVSVDVYYTE